MALTNESALSFLMPGVPFLPTVSPVTIQPIKATGIWIKKIPESSQDSQNPPVSLFRFFWSYMMQKKKKKEKKKRKKRLLGKVFCSLGIFSSLGQHVDGHRQGGEGEFRHQTPA